MTTTHPRLPVLPARTRDLIAAGYTPDRLRSRQWERTARGFVVPARESAIDDVACLQRVVDAAAWMPEGCALTGWAAALVCGVPGIDGRDPRTFRRRPVAIVRGSGQGLRAAPSVRVIRRPVGPTRVVPVRVADAVHGGPATYEAHLVDPAIAICDELMLRERPDTRVAFADRVLGEAFVSVADLRREAARRRGRPGVKAIREALELVNPRAASEWESILRVFCRTTVDLPPMAVNVPVGDPSGRLAGIVDLFDADAGLAVEFDGAYHRDRGQHRADNVREERLEGLGLIVVRVDSLDLLRHEQAAAARLRDARARGLDRDRTRDRWRVVADPRDRRPSRDRA